MGVQGFYVEKGIDGDSRKTNPEFAQIVLELDKNMGGYKAAAETLHRATEAVPIEIRDEYPDEKKSAKDKKKTRGTGKGKDASGNTEGDVDTESDERRKLAQEREKEYDGLKESIDGSCEKLCEKRAQVTDVKSADILMKEAEAEKANLLVGIDRLVTKLEADAARDMTNKTFPKSVETDLKSYLEKKITKEVIESVKEMRNAFEKFRDKNKPETPEPEEEPEKDKTPETGGEDDKEKPKRTVGEELGRLRALSEKYTGLINDKNEEIMAEKDAEKKKLLQQQRNELEAEKAHVCGIYAVDTSMGALHEGKSLRDCVAAMSQGFELALRDLEREKRVESLVRQLSIENIIKANSDEAKSIYGATDSLDSYRISNKDYRKLYVANEPNEKRAAAESLLRITGNADMVAFVDDKQTKISKLEDGRYKYQVSCTDATSERQYTFFVNFRTDERPKSSWGGIKYDITHDIHTPGFISKRDVVIETVENSKVKLGADGKPLKAETHKKDEELKQFKLDNLTKGDKLKLYANKQGEEDVVYTVERLENGMYRLTMPADENDQRKEVDFLKSVDFDLGKSRNGAGDEGYEIAPGFANEPIHIPKLYRIGLEKAPAEA